MKCRTSKNLKNMILSINFVILTCLKLFVHFLKHFRVCRYENRFIYFFWKAIKIAESKKQKQKKKKKKKTNKQTWSVGLAESQVFFLGPIYMFVGLIRWWVEVLPADRTTSKCIWTTAEPRVRFLQRKIGLSPPPIHTHKHTPIMYYWPFQGDTSVVVYSNSQCSSTFCLSLTYCSIYFG